jgi:hypothetical protein
MKNLIFQMSFWGWLLVFFSCKEIKQSPVEFPSDSLVDTIPFTLPFVNCVILEAYINEQPLSLLFDTGAENTLINSTIPSKKVSADTVFIRDVFDQHHPSLNVLLDTLQIGGLKVIKMDSYLQRDLNLDGIIGGDIIKDFVWKIDFYNQKMLVTKDVSNFNPKNDGIPFIKKGTNIYLLCKINGLSIPLLLDTGHDGFISINQKKMAAHPKVYTDPVFWEDNSALHSGNPFASKSYHPFMDTTYYLKGNIQVGDRFLPHEIIKIHKKSNNYIGMDFLKRFDHVIIDYPNQKIYLGEMQDKTLDFFRTSLLRLNSKGVILQPSDSLVKIIGITNEAKKLGLNYSDTVISIDHIPIQNRDSSFYVSKSKVHQEISYFEFTASEFHKLIHKFHFISDSSILEVKRGESSQYFTLIRQSNFKETPDVLLDYYVDLTLAPPKTKKIKTVSGFYFTFKTTELLAPGKKVE